MPLLENLVHIISLAKDNSQLVRWTKDLKIRWSSALASSTLFKCQKFFQIDKLLFEVNMMLFLYGALLRECAFDVQSTGKNQVFQSCLRLCSIGYTHLVYIVLDLVQSATLYRKAAGVYHTLAQEVIPPILSSLASERPPESTSSLSSVMSLICLAEAQVRDCSVILLDFSLVVISFLLFHSSYVVSNDLQIKFTGCSYKEGRRKRNNGKSFGKAALRCCTNFR